MKSFELYIACSTRVARRINRIRIFIIYAIEPRGTLFVYAAALGNAAVAVAAVVLESTEK